MRAKKPRSLTVEEVLPYFRTDVERYYSFMVSDYTLLAMNRFAPDLHYICKKANSANAGNYFSPSGVDFTHARSFEDIANLLIASDEVAAYIREQGQGKALLLMYNDKTEAALTRAGLELAHAPSSLFRYFDNKLIATKLAELLKVPAVPNYIGEIKDYEELRALTAAFGEDLVVQEPFGHSGETTHFIREKSDWLKAFREEVAPPALKVMPRLDCIELAVEGCATAAGSIVGPVLRELVGISQLTPFPGGWCGNQLAGDSLSTCVKEDARRFTARIGNALYKGGFRGYFEVDYLVDQAEEKVLFGELNPRISGAATISNAAIGMTKLPPMLLFHMLEWSNISLDADIEELNFYLSCDQLNRTPGQLLYRYQGEPTQIRSVPAAKFLTAELERKPGDNHSGGKFQFYPEVAAGNRVITGDELGYVIGESQIEFSEGKNLAGRWQEAICQFTGGFEFGAP